ncbi:MAG: GNAT family N-acetyltransferase [Bacteroidetes bacterium]|nr:GNAT family N-acetyltransferase [Bacteroidota bacterium]
MDKQEYTIRLITADDNTALASIIRAVMEEFDVARSGTIYYDPTLDAMYEQYQQPGAIYYIVETVGAVAGGCGINQLPGADATIYCELQRMFLAPHARKKGIAQHLMEKCLDDAKRFGYQFCYLETIKEFETAIRLYKKNGFEYYYHTLGNTGHHSCEIKMIKPL